MSKRLKFFIPYRLPGFNDFIKWAKISRGRWNKYATEKKDHEKNIVAVIGKKQKCMGKVKVKCIWVEPTKRRDPDNFCASVKLILDALVHSGVIKNDGWNDIEAISHRWYVNKHEPGVWVEVIKCEKKKN